MPASLKSQDKRALQAAVVQFENTMRDLEKFARIRHVDVSELKAQVQRDLETAQDLLREYGGPATPPK